MANKIIKPEMFPPDLVIQCIRGLNKNSVEIKTDDATGIIVNILISKIFPGELYLIPGWFWDPKTSSIRPKYKGFAAYTIRVYKPDLSLWLADLPWCKSENNLSNFERLFFICINYVEIWYIKNKKIKNFCLTTICLYGII